MEWPFASRDDEYACAARILDRDGPKGVLIVGDAGVGKSRLLGEVGRAAGERGYAVARSFASVATEAIPFAAFAGLLSGAGTQPTVDIFGRLRRRLQEIAAGRPVMVAVDDAHRLDEGSLALIHELVTGEGVRVALTARRDAAPSEALTTLWKDDHLDRIDLEPLPRGGVRRMLELRLAGPVRPATEHGLWAVTRGNPLYLRLLVEGGLASGAVHRTAGAWQWERDASPPTRLVDLVRERFASLAAQDQCALEMLALAAPVPEIVAHELITDEALEVLERQGLVEHVGKAPSTAVQLAHPLFAEVVVSGLGAATRTSHAARIAAAWSLVTGMDATLNAARWSLESGGEIAAPLAISAAREAVARLDVTLGERLARAAVAADPENADGHLLLAEVLRQQGLGAEAITALDHAADRAADDDQRARAAIARAETESLLLGRIDQAVASLRVAAATVTSPDAAARLAIERAFLGAFSGDFREVVAAAPAALEGVTDEATELTVAIVTTFAQALSLTLDGVEARLDRGLSLARRHQADLPLAVHQMNVSEVLAMVGRGAVGRAHVRATTGLEDCVRNHQPTGYWAVCVAFAGCLTGDLETAVGAALESHAALVEVDPFGLADLAASVGAVAALQADRPQLAAQLLEGAGSTGVSADERARAAIDGRVAVWQEVVHGGVDAAAALAAETGRSAVAASHCLWGAVTLYDAVRLGRADLVAGDLEVLAAEHDSGLVDRFHAHAVAAAGADAAALESAAAELLEAGCRQFAVEADAQAATAWAASGEEVAAARAASRAWVRWATCSGRIPHALKVAPPGLTEREREIAVLAGRGEASRDIAARLVLSVRTVDNHLRRVYRVLGIDGRHRIPSVLGL